MKIFFQKHGVVFCFALFVGLVSVLPSLLAPFALGDAYKGIQFLYLDDEDTYRSRIHEVLDGHYAVASPHLYEYKNTSSTVPPTGEYFYILPALLFGLAAAITLSKFLFPLILFLLCYFLVKMIVDEEGAAAKYCAIAAGLLVTLGFDLIDPHAFVRMIYGGDGTTHLLLWTRLVNPITGALVLFGFLICLWEVNTKKSSFWYVIAAAALLAVSVGYVFTLGMGLAVLGILFAMTLLQKNYDLCKRLFFVGLFWFILSIPYFYQMLHFLGGAAGREMSLRNGMFFTHAPIVNKLLLVVTLFTLASYCFERFIKKGEVKKHTWTFIAALLGGGWLAYNQQIITGREVWPFHFVQYTIPLCYVVVMSVTFLVWRKYFIRMWWGMIVCAIVVPMCYGVSSALSYTYNLGDFARRQDYSEVLSMLKIEAPRDCVAFVIDPVDPKKELEHLIPAYTQCNVYNSAYSFIGVPRERMLYNYLSYLRLNDVKEGESNDYFLAHDSEVRSYFYSDWKQVFGSGKEPWVLERIALLNDQYKEFLKGDLEAQLHEYRIDYIFSRTPLSSAVLKSLPALKFRGSLSGVYVYSFPLK